MKYNDKLNREYERKRMKKKVEDAKVGIVWNETALEFNQANLPEEWYVDEFGQVGTRKRLVITPNRIVIDGKRVI